MQEFEAQWLDQALKGNPVAFSQLVDSYQKPVYNLCYRMLGNAEDAEDASQETFLRAYKSMRRYDRSRPFSTWLLSIAAHYCIDQIRRRRMTVVSIEDLPVPDLPDHALGLEATVGLKEQQRRVRALLETLDATDRAAVIMYYWYDFSYEEISRALSLTESAVKSRLHRARRAMAQIWVEATASDDHPRKDQRMTHETYETLLFSDAPLSPEDQKSLQAHLQTCQSCRQLAAAWQAVEADMRTAPLLEPQPGFSNRWLEHLEMDRQRLQRRQALAALQFYIAGAFLLFGSLLILYWPTLQSPGTLILGWLSHLMVLVYFIGSTTDLLSSIVLTAVRQIPLIWWVLLAGITTELGVLWVVSFRLLTNPRRLVK